MNIGHKLQILYKSMNFKNWQEFGKFVDITGDWCLELSKKKEIATVDIKRLIKVCNKFNISMDWLLSDEETGDITVKEGYPEEDIGVMLDNIINRLKTKSQYYGTSLNANNSLLVSDAIEEVKKLIQYNL